MDCMIGIRILSCAVALAAGAAQAQPWMANGPGGIDLELKQIFRVETEGPRAATGTADPGFISEVGTAFAIAPRVLMTAKHVPHEAREYRNTSQSSVVWIPDRRVEISYARERLADPDTRDTQRVTITPSAIPTIDASRINLGELQVQPFPLSVCPITKGGTYYLVKLRNGDLGHPVAVPIIADTNEHSGAGDLRLFTHTLNTGHRDVPEGGDSGSPILDAQGRVVGLLTAILADTPDLYVTLTRDWVSLVPPQVKVACDTSVTTRDLDVLAGQMTAYIDAQIQPLHDDVAALAARADALGLADVAFDTELANINVDVARVRLRTTATVQAMTDRFEGEDFQDQVFRDVFNKLRDAEPVIPAVNRMNESVNRMAQELSQETWSFDYATYDNDLGGHFVEVRYSRDITAQPYAGRLQLCAKAMLPPGTGVDPDDLRSSEDRTHRSYYRIADRDPENNMDRCQDKEHQVLGRGGLYKFPVYGSDPAYDDFADWNGMIYVTIFDPTEMVEDTDSPQIIHRLVLVFDPEAPSATPDCYYFGYRAGGGVTDDIASFAARTDEQLSGAETCPG